VLLNNVGISSRWQTSTIKLTNGLPQALLLVERVTEKDTCLMLINSTFPGHLDGTIVGCPTFFKTVNIIVSIELIILAAYRTDFVIYLSSLKLVENPTVLSCVV